MNNVSIWGACQPRRRKALGGRDKRGSGLGAQLPRAKAGAEPCSGGTLAPQGVVTLVRNRPRERRGTAQTAVISSHLCGVGAEHTAQSCVLASPAAVGVGRRGGWSGVGLQLAAFQCLKDSWNSKKEKKKN